MRQPRAFYEADSLHTEIYDALAASIIAGSPVAGDVEFYRGLAKETGGPVLEVLTPQPGEPGGPSAARGLGGGAGAR